MNNSGPQPEHQVQAIHKMVCIEFGGEDLQAPQEPYQTVDELVISNTSELGDPIEVEDEVLQARQTSPPYQTVDELVSSNTLELGDPIEFEDEFLQHWAIYAGKEIPDNEEALVPVVVHFFSLNGNPHEVRYDSLETASCGKRCRVNKKYDQKAVPFTGLQIMKTAHRKIGQTNYNIVFNNCEHFVTFCRNGQGFSDQIAEARASKKKQWQILAAAVSSGFSTATYSLKSLFTKNTSWECAQIVAKEAEPGDLIEFLGRVFRHWAIYAGYDDDGEPMIVHFYNSNSEGYKVQYNSLVAVADGRQCHVYNKYDGRKSPYDADTIMKRAHRCVKESQNGTYQSYSCTAWNCEHFASWCRNGVGYSDQITRLNLGNPNKWWWRLLNAVGEVANNLFRANKIKDA